MNRVKKQSRSKSPRRIASCLMILGIGGCNARPQAELAPVTGIVLLDEKPLRTGTIITTPEAGRGAEGAIDSSGRFSLATRGIGEGAVIGSHQVAVIVTDSVDSTAISPEAEVKLAVPSRYTQAASSGLQIEVQPNQPNEVTLKLTSAQL